jgi:hypothetical protein
MSDIVERLRKGGPCIEAAGCDGGGPCKVMNASSGCACAEAADTITFLRAELEKMRADIAYADKHASKVEGLLWGTAKENEKLRAALSPFASTKADDGYDYISGLPDTVIVRIEASVGEMKAARAALSGDKHE